jgi:hypothetical protein
MKRCIILGFLFLFINNLHAQNYDRTSGFLGRRIMVGGGGATSLSGEPQRAISEDKVSEFAQITLNTMWHVETQLVISSQAVVSVLVGTQNTSLAINDGLNRLGWGKQYNHNNFEHTLFLITGSPGIKDQYIGLGLKQYSPYWGSLAPIGAYWKVGVNFHKVSVDFSQMRYHTSSNVGFGVYENLVHRHEFAAGVLYSTELLGSFGKTRPLTERLILDVHADAGYFIIKETNEMNLNKVGVNTIDQIKRRLKNGRILTLNASLNYLIF